LIFERSGESDYIKYESEYIGKKVKSDTQLFSPIFHYSPDIHMETMDPAKQIKPKIYAEVSTKIH